MEDWYLAVKTKRHHKSHLLLLCRWCHASRTSVPQLTESQRMPVSCYLSFYHQQWDKVEADCLLARMEVTNAALLKQTIGFSIKAVKAFSSQGFEASVQLSPTHLVFFSSYTVAGE